MLVYYEIVRDIGKYHIRFLYITGDVRKVKDIPIDIFAYYMLSFISAQAHLKKVSTALIREKSFSKRFWSGFKNNVTSRIVILSKRD